MGNHGSSLIAVDDAAACEQTAYVPNDMRMMIEYLPDFVLQYHSTAGDQAVILAHWDKLFVQSKQGGTATALSPMVVLFETFYKHLFELAPEIKPLFHSSMQVQGNALVRIVGSIKSMLQSPNLIEFASDLGMRHVQYGIKLPHFNALGLALLKTLCTCSEELWTPETELAWKKVYAHVALIVLSELNKLQPGRRRSSLLHTFGVYEGEKAQFGVGHPHHGHTLSPNATCPVSGNSLKRMPQPAPPPLSLSQRVLGVLGLGASTKYQTG